MASLSLGTASFGTAYGIANAGRPSEFDVARILLEAGGRVPHLDTAPAYACQRLLGRYMSPGAFRVTTKTKDGKDLFHTLTELRRRTLYAALLHDPESLEVWPELVAFRAAGWVDKVGVACYTEDDIGRAMDLDPRPDVIQVPVNVLDGRLWGLLPELHEKGVEIHARSVFLQGLILMDPDALPAFAQPAEGQLRRFQRSCGKRGLSPAAGALGYVLGLPFVDVAVVGVDSLAQLDEALGAAPLHFNQEFCVQDEAVLDPRRWTK